MHEGVFQKAEIARAAEYYPAKPREYVPQFSKLRMLRKRFVLGRYLFLEAQSVSFSEQIMSADKYRSIFSRQMEAVVYYYHTPYSKMAAVSDELGRVA